MQNFYEILIACVVCIFIFFISHAVWLWNHKKKETMPVFWERIFLALLGLYVFSRISPEKQENFAIWLVIFYLLFLFAHTWIIYHKMSQQEKQKPFEDKNHTHEPGK